MSVSAETAGDKVKPPIPPARRSIPYLLALNLTTFGLTLWANVTNPNLYQYKLTQLVPNGQINTRLGLYAIAGLIVATIAQPLIGSLSDRTRSRFGRRAPYMAVGVIGVVLALAWIAAAPDTTALLIGILFGQVVSNTIQGPWQALSPDQVPDDQKGTSAGFKTILELVAVIVSGIIVQQFLAHDQITSAVIVVGAISLITTLLTIGVARTKHDLPGTMADQEIQSRQPLIATFRALDPTIRHNLTWWLINRFLFWAGLTTVRQFVINDMIDVGHYSESQALSISGEFTILLGVGIVLATLPAGYFSDRFGRTRLIAASSIVACLGAILLIFARQAEPLYLIAIVAGVGVGMYFSTNWALITSLVPVRDAALFLGIANAATTLGSITGQLGGPLIDTVNRATHSVIGYFILFGLAAISFALSAIAIGRVREIRPVRSLADRPAPESRI